MSDDQTFDFGAHAAWREYRWWVVMQFMSARITELRKQLSDSSNPPREVSEVLLWHGLFEQMGCVPPGRRPWHKEQAKHAPIPFIRFRRELFAGWCETIPVNDDPDPPVVAIAFTRRQLDAFIALQALPGDEAIISALGSGGQTFQAPEEGCLPKSPAELR